MVSTAYKCGTYKYNDLSRPQKSFFHSTFCTYNSLFTSKPRIPICRFTEMSIGLIVVRDESRSVAEIKAQLKSLIDKAQRYEVIFFSLLPTAIQQDTYTCVQNTTNSRFNCNASSLKTEISCEHITQPADIFPAKPHCVTLSLLWFCQP